MRIGTMGLRDTPVSKEGRVIRRMEKEYIHINNSIKIKGLKVT